MVLVVYLAIVKNADAFARSRLFILTTEARDNHRPAHSTISELCCEHGTPMRPVSRDGEAHRITHVHTTDTCRVDILDIHSAGHIPRQTIAKQRGTPLYNSSAERPNHPTHHYPPRQSLLISAKLSAAYMKKFAAGHMK